MEVNFCDKDSSNDATMIQGRNRLDVATVPP